jgi:hypothetical protein
VSEGGGVEIFFSHTNRDGTVTRVHEREGYRCLLARENESLEHVL